MAYILFLLHIFFLIKLNHENYTFKVSWSQTLKNCQWRTLEIISKDIKILSKNIPQISKKSNKIVGLVESRIIHMDSSLLWRVMPDL